MAFIHCASILFLVLLLVFVVAEPAVGTADEEDENKTLGSVEGGERTLTIDVKNELTDGYVLSVELINDSKPIVTDQEFVVFPRAYGRLHVHGTPDVNGQTNGNVKIPETKIRFILYKTKSTTAGKERVDGTFVGYQTWEFLPVNRNKLHASSWGGRYEYALTSGNNQNGDSSEKEPDILQLKVRFQDYEYAMKMWANDRPELIKESREFIRPAQGRRTKAPTADALRFLAWSLEIFAAENQGRAPDSKYICKKCQKSHKNS